MKPGEVGGGGGGGGGVERGGMGVFFFKNGESYDYVKGSPLIADLITLVLLMTGLNRS